MDEKKIHLITNTATYGTLLASFIGVLLIFILELKLNFVFQKPEGISASDWKHCCFPLLMTTDFIFAMTAVLAAGYGIDKLAKAGYPKGFSEYNRYVLSAKSFSGIYFFVVFFLIVVSFCTFYIRFRELAYKLI